MNNRVGVAIITDKFYTTDVAWVKDNFSWVDLICTWPDEIKPALAMLESADIEVRYLRFMNDPRPWGLTLPKVPMRCINEPDNPVEQPTGEWCKPVEDWWRSQGLPVMEPAYMNEDNTPKDINVPGVGYPNKYDIHTAHCYNDNWINANKVAIRCDDGRPVVITEYGRPKDQANCFKAIEAAHVNNNDIVLFALRWDSSKGYDLSGITFN